MAPSCVLRRLPITTLTLALGLGCRGQDSSNEVVSTPLATHSCDSGSAEQRGTPAARVAPSGSPSTFPGGIQAVGTQLTGAPRITLEELLARPEEHVGKLVRLEGTVSAMCHHQRAWFSVAESAAPGARFVRVVTAPEFLVPLEIIGRQARTEGTVELVDVPAPTARHYAADHGLGDPKAVAGPVRSVILRARGAEFL